MVDLTSAATNKTNPARRKSKKRRLLCIFFLILLVLLVIISIWFCIFVSTVDIPKEGACSRHAELQPYYKGRGDIKPLLILVWTWPFGERFPLDTCLSEFGVPGCNLTIDRNVSDHADAIIIHHYDIMQSRDLLPKGPRPHYQRWVWFNFESPIIIKNLDMVENLINLTMTYRQDSDIFIPYGFLKQMNIPQTFTIPTKTKLVAWLVSMWYSGNRRTKYYEELRKYIQIDVYGKEHKPLNWEDFSSTLEQYKFYLAFENCGHKDYITEKLWRNAFGNMMVPVVLGATRENYERFMPSDSFIHVDDFSSPKDLSEFLLVLDKDDVKYKQYFNWRSRYTVERNIGWDTHFCKACSVLHQVNGYQTIPSIEKWFINK
ncbi:galactoside 3(4)-L-fucosyltransferase-like [Pelobates cultripes]|uniref:Fucosyltransferase n=1 Tax=Pelobates cultripes TaxID=61616 RepID=A0AAD1WU73_PELCU|nr:galactoside 3(4)-L-fucosyltransferase-like [Pelobates cultripes]